MAITEISPNAHCVIDILSGKAFCCQQPAKTQLHWSPPATASKQKKLYLDSSPACWFLLLKPHPVLPPSEATYFIRSCFSFRVLSQPADDTIFSWLQNQKYY